MNQIEVKLQDTQELTKDDWIECQNIAFDAYRSTLLNEQGAQIGETALRFMNWMDDPERYYRAHVDPNTEVGESRRPDQDYRHPRVARAYVDGVIAGFGWSADNVSGGSELVRNLKRRFPLKNYFAVQEIMTLPEYQHDPLKVATENAKALLHDATSPQQTVTHWDWPSLQPNFVNDKLLRVGLKIVDEKPHQLFGPGTDEIMRAHRAGLTVEQTLARLSMTS